MLTEREKIIALISRVRAVTEVNLYEDEDNARHIIAAGEQIIREMCTELGIRPQKEIIDEIIKFEDELNVVSDILNKEDYCNCGN